ncbi:ATP-binding cassette domain-containing protein [Actinomadura sp. 21ATH]|uniref:ATP-binding cassette domain-containing protein n=1 Tax=Actinomadura sp. 21ATH TaxID=1735444 RepID=UPI0035C09190
MRVRGHGLSLRGPRGWVYRDVDLDVPAGGLAAVHGIGGSGRTALLLTLGGRMKATSGTGSVGPHPLTDLRAVQRVAALGLFAEVNELDPALTVREHVGEALDLNEGLRGRWRGRRGRIRAALDRAGLEIDPDLLARDLDPDEARLLGAALALTGDPGLLLLDDVDHGLRHDRQRALWRCLHAIARSGVTVIASCDDPAPAEGLARFVALEET